MASPAPGLAQERSRTAPADSLLVRAGSALAAGDTLGAESLAAAAHHAARGRDVDTYLAADRFLMDVARARSAADPLLAAERYDRLTGRAQAESVLTLDLERRRDELRRTELMLRATGPDSVTGEATPAASLEDRGGTSPPGVGAGASADARGGAVGDSPAGPARAESGAAAPATAGEAAEETGGPPRVLLLGALAALVLGSLAGWHAARRRRRAAPGPPTRDSAST
ncbi:MAG TPA: hypothetical protein VIC56_02120 [Gemmatimonadota bacterium]